jgi:hypothetical protein
LTAPPVLRRMEQQVDIWKQSADRKAVFLQCYSMMTGNMYEATVRGDFADALWVQQLLEHFAEYYFDALHNYINNDYTALPVWRIAHDAALDPDVSAVQLLLLGVNAHINYDLVFAVEDLLAPTWSALHTVQQNARYEDYCHVNTIIARTIDDVQDAVIAPGMPWMRVLDGMMGRIDEFMIASLLAHWRDEVWQNVLRLLEIGQDSDMRLTAIQEIERSVVRRADLLVSGQWFSLLRPA